jgi:hypothetical protein
MRVLVTPLKAEFRMNSGTFTNYKEEKMSYIQNGISEKRIAKESEIVSYFSKGR